MTLDNLNSSSRLLGFNSIARKAEEYQTFNAADDAGKFAAMLSDLGTELRRCELEWISRRNATGSLPKPRQRTAVAVRRR